SKIKINIYAALFMSQYITGLQMEEMKTSLAQRYYDIINNGSRSVTLWREILYIKPTNANVTAKVSAWKLKHINNKVARVSAAADYPGGVSAIIPACNYGARTDASEINFYIVHYTAATYQSAINWFNTCDRVDENGNPLGATSAHYIVRNADGEISQLVLEKDRAFAAGVDLYNHQGISVEHEVIVSDLAMWESEQMLCAASQLCADVCNRNGIPLKRKQINGNAGIYGHNEVKIDANGNPLTLCPNLTPERWNQFMIHVTGAGSEANKLFNTCTTPIFTTNNFKTINVGKDGAVWAGTNAGGLYKYSAGEWTPWGGYPTVNYQDIKTDQNGGVWIAQNGYNGAQSITGGMLYFPNASFEGYSYFGTVVHGLPSNNLRSVFVDTTRYNGPTTLPVVWSACYAMTGGGAAKPGGIARGVNPVAPQFNSIKTGIEIDNTFKTGGVFYIGGNAQEIWSFATNNFGRNQIIRHNAQTNALIGAYDAVNGLAGLVSDQFLAKAIYFDAKGNKWVTVNGVGILVQDKDGNWTKISDQTLFTANPFFNNNGIAGDTSGNVYFGTLYGLVSYKPGSALDDADSYTLYTTAQGLPNNNVQGICIDTLRKKLWVATGDGIALWAPLCSNTTFTRKTFTTSKDGDWLSADNWCSGQVPSPTDEVIIRHRINITTDTKVKMLKCLPGGFTTVVSPAKLEITQK
ncbi:MAG: N-acetylmuramoyl-L-alanine amidase, partial [Ferruginibacter sp.]